MITKMPMSLLLFSSAPTVTRAGIGNYQHGLHVVDEHAECGQVYPVGVGHLYRDGQDIPWLSRCWRPPMRQYLGRGPLVPSAMMYSTGPCATLKPCHAVPVATQQPISTATNDLA